MSTYYKELNYPWSSIRVSENPAHTRITLWEKGANVGTIVVSTKEAPSVISQFFGKEDVMQHFASGRPSGVSLVRLEDRPPRADQMLSEYGEIVSLRDLERKFDPEYYTKEEAENVV